MGWFDLVVIAIIGSFGLFGLWFGFIHTLGSLAGTLVGAYLASRYYEPMADWLVHVTGWGGNLTKVIMFVIAFIIINRLVGFAFWIVDKILSIVTHLPFISSINHVLGLFLGLLEGVITVGLILYFIDKFPLSDRVMEQVAHSVIAPKVIAVASVLLPLLPEALRLLRSSVDYVEKTFAR